MTCPMIFSNLTGIFSATAKGATMNQLFTVWVGGIPDVEGVSLKQAHEIAEEWIRRGFDDVLIQLNNEGAQ